MFVRPCVKCRRMRLRSNDLVFILHGSLNKSAPGLRLPGLFSISQSYLKMTWSYDPMFHCVTFHFRFGDVFRADPRRSFVHPSFLFLLSTSALLPAFSSTRPALFGISSPSQSASPEGCHLPHQFPLRPHPSRQFLLRRTAALFRYAEGGQRARTQRHII